MEMSSDAVGENGTDSGQAGEVQETVQVTEKPETRDNEADQASDTELPPAQEAAATANSPSDESPLAAGDPQINQGLLPYASPGVRKFARELGANLLQIKGTGPKGRILKPDVKTWVKDQLGSKAPSNKAAAQGSGIPPIPEVDFSGFGEIESVTLSRIKRLSGPHLHRAWLNIPHVTHHDEADITNLEEFRKSLKKEAEAQGLRITILSFVMKALVAALKKFPAFNASLAANGQELLLKKWQVWQVRDSKNNYSNYL